MSDDTIEEIERHNVLCARRIVEYWLKQGVRIELPNDPTKALRTVVGPNGLPRGYAGEDAIRTRRRSPRTARLARHPYLGKTLQPSGHQAGSAKPYGGADQAFLTLPASRSSPP